MEPSDGRPHVSVAYDVHRITYGLSSDLLLQFAVVFSGLILDVGHTGLTNMELSGTNDPVGELEVRSGRFYFLAMTFLLELHHKSKSGGRVSQRKGVWKLACIASCHFIFEWVKESAPVLGPFFRSSRKSMDGYRYISSKRCFLFSTDRGGLAGLQSHQKLYVAGFFGIVT
jgi:hypothetical protein